MSKFELQCDAISMAVNAALNKIGYENLRHSEFFGTNQCSASALSRAA